MMYDIAARYGVYDPTPYVSPRGHPRPQSDNWLNEQWPPLLVSVQSTLVMVQLGSHRCSGSSVFPCRGSEPPSLGALPLLAASTLEASRSSVSRLLHGLFDGAAPADGPTAASGVPSSWRDLDVTRGGVMVQFWLHAWLRTVLVWVHRYPPLATEAGRLGLTAAPLYPCESPSVPYALRDIGDWPLVPRVGRGWDGYWDDSTPSGFNLEAILASDDSAVGGMTPSSLLACVLGGLPLLLMARYGAAHSDAAGDNGTDRVLRLLREQAHGDFALTWTSHVQDVTAPDVRRCLVCCASVVRHVCALDAGLSREVSRRAVLSGLRAWGWNGRGRRDLVLHRRSVRKR